MSTCTTHFIAVAQRRGLPNCVPREETRRARFAAQKRNRDPLGRAIALLDRGLPIAADETLTAALLEDARNADLWLAAGVARMRRGALGSARSAFEMCAWLSDDPVAREFAAILG